MHECNICKSYARKTLAKIKCHIREVHSHFERKVKCIVSNCPSTLSSYKSLRHHMYKYHKDALKNSHSSDIASEVCTDTSAEANSLEGNSTAIK